MTLALDRRALADSIRSHPGFRELTKQIEAKTVKVAQELATTRVKRRTGAYAGNFETTVTPLSQTANLARLRLFNTLDYAIIIERGSRPHVIRPRHATVLAFDVDGEQVFTNIVNHPGTKPQNIIRDALLKIASGQ